MLRFTAYALAKSTVRRRTVAAASATAAAGSHTSSSTARPEVPVSSVSAAADASAAAHAPSTPSTPKKKIVKKIVRKKVIKGSAAKKGSAAPAEPTTGAVHTGDELTRELRGIASAVSPRDGGADGSEGGAGAAGAHKTAMVKGFKIDEVLSLCSPSDAIFARRLPSGGCQFFAWPGTPLEVASAAIVSMPDTIRTVHAVFGRRHTPIDLVMDVDCAVPKEEWSMAKIRPFQQKVLDDVMTVVVAELEKTGEKIEKQVVLQSPNLKKASFHIHTRLKGVAFADYESVHGFLVRFQDKIPTVDTQIYRANGMLRMYSCMKENRTSAMAVLEGSKWNIGFPNGQVPPEEAALLSVCVRDAGSFSRVLTFRAPWQTYGARADGASDHDHSADASGDGAAAAGTRPGPAAPVLIPRNAAEAIQNASTWLRHASEAEVGEWRSWIGLGLCAFRVGHQFRDAAGLERPAMEQMLKAWEEASRQCPQKYRQGECAEKWATFDPTKILQTSESGWWGAYKRLGHLQWATQEALALEKASRRK